MAKQRQSGIVGAAQTVSESQGNFINQGGRFALGYEKGLETKRKKEEENKAIQGRANTLMDGFTNDIDVLKFKPEDQALVKNKVVAWRNEYAEAANAASKLEDKTGAEYQLYMDTMNDIKGRMSNLSNNINNLAATKGEYGKNIQAGHYSSAGSNDMALHQGLIMTEFPIGSIDDTGNLMWSDESAGDFNMQDYQLPFEKANGVATQLDAIASPLTTQKGPLTEFERERITEQVEGLVGSNPNVLQSFISDNDLKQFNFNDIDPEDPDARDIVVSRLTQAMFDAKGSGLVDSTKKSNGKPGGWVANNVVKPNLVATVNDMEAFEKEILTNQFTGPRETKSWSFGGSSNPEQLKIKYDPRTGKWTYLNAKKVSERREADSLSELMTELPRLFYK
jgi:hypothetical protein